MTSWNYISRGIQNWVSTFFPVVMYLAVTHTNIEQFLMGSDI